MVSEALFRKLNDKAPAKRRNAMDAIAKKGHPDGLACLIERLSDSTASIRAHARKLLKATTTIDLGSSRLEWTKWWKQNASRACRVCGRWLYAQKLYYKVKTDITAEPKEIIFTEDDLKKDNQAEIDRICSELSTMPAEEVQDEVWVHLEYFLCTPCKKEFVKRTRDGAPNQA